MMGTLGACFLVLAMTLLTVLALPSSAHANGPRTLAPTKIHPSWHCREQKVFTACSSPDAEALKSPLGPGSTNINNTQVLISGAAPMSLGVVSGSTTGLTSAHDLANASLPLGTRGENGWMMTSLSPVASTVIPLAQAQLYFAVNSALPEADIQYRLQARLWKVQYDQSGEIISALPVTDVGTSPVTTGITSSLKEIGPVPLTANGSFDDRLFQPGEGLLLMMNVLVDSREVTTNRSLRFNLHSTSSQRSQLLFAAPPAAPTLILDPTTEETNASFEWTNVGGPIEKLTCSLDGAPFTPCASGISYTSLADGTHTFVVKAENSNISGTNSTNGLNTYTWTAYARPVNTLLPAITGVSTLTCDPGQWLYNPTSYTYEFRRDNETVAQAASALNTYLLTGADLGYRIYCRVVATNLGGDSLPADSALTDEVGVQGGPTLEPASITSVSQPYAGRIDIDGDTFENVETVELLFSVGDPLLLNIDGDNTVKDSNESISLYDPTIDGQTLIGVNLQANNNFPLASSGMISLQTERVAEVTGGSDNWETAAPVTMEWGGTIEADNTAAALLPDYYEYRVTDDGGNTWSATSGNIRNVDISDEGTTHVQARACADTKCSTWGPSVTAPDGRAKIDTVAPDVTNFTGAATLASSLIRTGNNVCYSPLTAASNSFNLRVDAVDATSGVQRAAFPAVSDLGTGSTSGAGDKFIPNSGVTYISNNYSFGTSANADGTVTITVYDVAGNSSQVDVDITKDELAPSAPIVTGGNVSYINDPSTTMVATPPSGDSGCSTALASSQEYRSKFGSGSFGANTPSSGLVTVTAEGLTEVQFRNRDALGNASDYTVASSTARLDRTAPTLGLGGDTSGAWRNTPANLTLTTTDPGVATYKAGLNLNYSRTGVGATTGTYALGSANLSHTLADQGTANWTVNACDTAGNCAAPASTTTKIDSIAPANPNTSGGNPTWVNDASTVLTGTFTQTPGDVSPDTIRHQSTRSYISINASTPPTNGGTLTVTLLGLTTVDFQVYDAAGNESSWIPTPHPARLDRVAPSLAVTGDTSQAWRNTAATLTLTTADPGNGVVSAGLNPAALTYTRTGPAAASGTYATGSDSLFHLANGAQEGTSDWTFNACDGAGNCATQATAKTRVDTIAPVAPVVVGGNASYTSVFQSVFTSTPATETGDKSPYSSTEYRTAYNGAAYGPAAATPETRNVTAEGETFMQMRSIDAAGNISAWATANQPARLDRTAPVMTAFNRSANNGIWCNASCTPSLSWSGDNATGVAYRAGFAHYATSWIGNTSATSHNPSVGQGTTNFSIQACDAAGNCSSGSGTNYQTSINYDTVAPSVFSGWVCSGGTLIAGYCEEANAIWSPSSSDGTSGVASVSGDTAYYAMPIGTSAQTRSYTATDNAGNSANRTGTMGTLDWLSSVVCARASNTTVPQCTFNVRTQPFGNANYSVGSSATGGVGTGVTGGSTGLINLLCSAGQNTIVNFNSTYTDPNTGHSTTGSWQLTRNTTTCPTSTGTSWGPVTAISFADN
jgi:hypothetical protein